MDGETLPPVAVNLCSAVVRGFSNPPDAVSMVVSLSPTLAVVGEPSPPLVAVMRLSSVPGQVECGWWQNLSAPAVFWPLQDPFLKTSY